MNLVLRNMEAENNEFVVLLNRLLKVAKWFGIVPLRINLLKPELRYHFRSLLYSLCVCGIYSFYSCLSVYLHMQYKRPGNYSTRTFSKVVGQVHNFGFLSVTLILLVVIILERKLQLKYILSRRDLQSELNKKYPNPKCSHLINFFIVYFSIVLVIKVACINLFIVILTPNYLNVIIYLNFLFSSLPDVVNLLSIAIFYEGMMFILFSLKKINLVLVENLFDHQCKIQDQELLRALEFASTVYSKTFSLKQCLNRMFAIPLLLNWSYSFMDTVLQLYFQYTVFNNYFQNNINFEANLLSTFVVYFVCSILDLLIIVYICVLVKKEVCYNIHVIVLV